MLEKEHTKYFETGNSEFTTPICMVGSEFQQNVWHELQNIPVGQTLSYKELAIKIGNEKTCRAVARANGANQIAIIIPSIESLIVIVSWVAMVVGFLEKNGSSNMKNYTLRYKQDCIFKLIYENKDNLDLLTVFCHRY